MSEKLSENSEMSSAAEAIRSEMRERVRLVAALSPEPRRKAALRFAAMVLRLPHDRVRRLFYGEARRIEAHEADQIRAYVAAAEKLIEARERYEAERRALLAEAHQGVVRLAPRALGSKTLQACEEAAAAVAARGTRRR